MRALVYLITILFSFSLFTEQYVSAKGDKTLDIYQLNRSNGKLNLKKKLGVSSSTLTVFRRDQNTATLKTLETYEKSKNPMWILILEK